MSVALEGIRQKAIGMGVGPLDPIQDVKADRPWVGFFQAPHNDGASKLSRPRHLLEPGDTLLHRRVCAEKRENASPF